MIRASSESKGEQSRLIVDRHVLIPASIVFGSIWLAEQQCVDSYDRGQACVDSRARSKII